MGELGELSNDSSEGRLPLRRFGPLWLVLPRAVCELISVGNVNVAVKPIWLCRQVFIRVLYC